MGEAIEQLSVATDSARQRRETGQDEGACGRFALSRPWSGQSSAVGCWRSPPRQRASGAAMAAQHRNYLAAKESVAQFYATNLLPQAGGLGRGGRIRRATARWRWPRTNSRPLTRELGSNGRFFGLASSASASSFISPFGACGLVGRPNREQSLHKKHARGRRIRCLDARARLRRWPPPSADCLRPPIRSAPPPERRNRTIRSRSRCSTGPASTSTPRSSAASSKSSATPSNIRPPTISPA